MPTVGMVSTKQAKKLINHAHKFMFLMIRPQRSKRITTTSQLSIDHNFGKQWQVDRVLEEYKDVFKDPAGIPLHFQVKHSIDLVTSSSLPNAYVYRRYILENEEIYRKIPDLINKGHILPNSSTCVSPVILVPKKDGTLCMCIDCRAFDKTLVKNWYPLPRKIICLIIWKMLNSLPNSTSCTSCQDIIKLS